MTGKPEGEQEESKPIVVGPSTRITFAGVALLGLLGGLCAGVFAVAVGLERFNRNMENRMTHDQMFRWTLEAQRALPTLPMYVPPRPKDD